MACYRCHEVLNVETIILGAVIILVIAVTVWHTRRKYLPSRLESKTA